MAVRRQAYCKNRAVITRPLQSPCLFVFRKCTTRDKDGGEKEKEEEGLVRRYPTENKQSSMERGRGVMTDSAKLPVQWLSTPFRWTKYIYIYLKIHVCIHVSSSSPYRWLINPDLMPRLLEL